MKLRRQTPERIERAVVERQRQLLAEKDQRILALEVELEATRATVAVDETLLVQTWQHLARVQRARAEFYKSQVQLAVELLEARRLREGNV